MRGVEVEWASSGGRDAADREIVRRLPRRVEEHGQVVVVTSDRALAAQIQRGGASVEPSFRFRRTLDQL